MSALSPDVLFVITLRKAVFILSNKKGYILPFKGYI